MLNSVSNILDSLSNNDLFTSSILKTKKIDSVKSTVVNGYRFYEVNVAGFDKDNLTLNYDKDSNSLIVSGRVDKETSSRELNMTLSVAEKPEDAKVKNGILSFKVKEPEDKEPEDNGFESIDLQ